MFRVEVNNGTFVMDYDEKVVTTVGEIISTFQNDNRFRFAADPIVYDSSQNAAMPYDTPTSENRTYAMTCWITQQLDEKGEPIKRTVLI